MKGIIGALLVASAVTSPAGAEVLFSNNFDAENGGIQSSPYTSFTGFNVVSSPVGLVGQGANGLPCAGGSGLCALLKGTASAEGTLRSISTFDFQAGDTISLSWDLRGMRTSNFAGNYIYGFNFTTPVTISTKNGTESTSQFAGFDMLMGSTEFQTKTLTFNAISDGSFRFFLGGRYGAGEGMLLDNVVLTRTSTVTVPGVPEPATWAMMLAGFGITGGALRSRKRSALSRT